MKLLQTLAAVLLFFAYGCNSNEMDSMSDTAMPFLGNETCPMTGEAIDEASYLEHEGQRVYFCCDKCAKAAGADPASAVHDAYGSAMAVGNATCPISGKAVGDASASWQGHEVGLCCPNCAAPFKKDAAANTAKAMMK